MPITIIILTVIARLVEFARVGTIGAIADALVALVADPLVVAVVLVGLVVRARQARRAGCSRRLAVITAAIGVIRENAATFVVCSTFITVI